VRTFACLRVPSKISRGGSRRKGNSILPSHVSGWVRQVRATMKERTNETK